MRNNLKLDVGFDKIGLSEDIIIKLNLNNIFTIDDILNLKRVQLKEVGFNNDEIKHIIIKLQLLGLDLNKTKY